MSPPRHPDLPVGEGAYRGAETTGFVSPASDHIEGPIDLADALDLRRPGRYPVRVLGEGLLHRGILPADVLVVDAAAEPRAGVVAIVMIGGEVLLGQLARRGDQWFLRSSRPDRLPLHLAEDAEIWAVVVSLVRERV